MARPVRPGRLRRRLTIAFVLVATVSTTALAVTSYLLVQSSRFNDSLRQSRAEARQVLFLAADQLGGRPLDDEQSSLLLNRFETIERPVLLVRGDRTEWAGQRFDAVPGSRARAAAAAGNLGFQRSRSGGRHLLLVGGRIPGYTDELYLVRDEDRLYSDLAQLRNALLGGSLLVIAVAALV